MHVRITMASFAHIERFAFQLLFFSLLALSSLISFLKRFKFLTIAIDYSVFLNVIVI